MAGKSLGWVDTFVLIFYANASAIPVTGRLNKGVRANRGVSHHDFDRTNSDQQGT